MRPQLRFAVGGIECRILVDGRGCLPLAHVYEDVSAYELEAAVGDGGWVPEVPYQALLIRGSDALVLVDAGIGGFPHPFGGSGGALFAELEAAGVTPDEIDVVVVTHGHLDHVGGLVRDGRPAFPGARHLMARRDWEHWTSEEVLTELPEAMAAPARASLPPLEEAGVLELFDEAREIVGGVSAVAAPGHTPGHTAVEIRVDGEGALYLVDTVIHEFQFSHPTWGSIDGDRDQAVATRRRLLERAAEENLLVAAAHVPVFGHLERQGSGFTFLPSV